MLLSLQQAILIRPKRPWMEAFAALLGGALLVLVGGIMENKYIKYMQTIKAKCLICTLQSGIIFHISILPTTVTVNAKLVNNIHGNYIDHENNIVTFRT